MLISPHNRFKIEDTYMIHCVVPTPVILNKDDKKETQETRVQNKPIPTKKKDKEKTKHVG